MFWSDLWTNLLADVLAGATLTFLIFKLFDSYRQPKLEIVLTIGTGTKGRRTFKFYCHNVGKSGLMQNEIQWQIYFDSAFKIENNVYDQIEFTYNRKSHFAISGFNSEPCLPNSSCQLASIDVIINSEELEYDFVDQAPFYYSLTTVKGKVSSSELKKLPKVQILDQIERSVYQIKKINI